MPEEYNEEALEEQLFSQEMTALEYGPEVKTTTAEALMHVSNDYGPQCYAVQPHKAFIENNNAIIFTDEDMEMAFPDHQRPLYLE
ncbi:hypothetical protein ACFX2K_034572 [Malus domestica]